jgi:Protein of unknown function (DUF3667)
MKRQLRPSPSCLNCGVAVATRYCAECGQENTDYRVSLRRLLGDLVDEVFQLESRLWRSLWHLFRHPGRLTRDYNAGRRIRYTTPLRLYLLASFAYFFVATVVPVRYDAAQLKIEAAKEGVTVDFDHLPPPKNWLERRIRERMGPNATSAEIARRSREALVTNTPKVMVAVVPLFALILMLFFRGRFYVEHLVFTLHMHASGFLLGAAAMVTPSSWAYNLSLLASMV